MGGQPSKSTSSKSNPPRDPQWYNNRSEFEDFDAYYKPTLTPHQLSFHAFLLPQAGGAFTSNQLSALFCGDIDIFSESTTQGGYVAWWSEEESRGQTPFPYLRPSNRFSLIELNDKFTLNHLVHHTEIIPAHDQIIPDNVPNARETNMKTFQHLLPLWTDITPNNPPNLYYHGSYTPALGNPFHERFHTLLCRYIFEKIMSQGRIIYCGSRDPLILKNNGKEYVCVQHPTFVSQLHPQPVDLLFFYPLHVLEKLTMINFTFHAPPLDLVRSSIYFRSTPLATVTNELPLNVNLASHQGQAAVSVPLSFLFLDCITSQAIHTLHSYIYALLLAHAANSTIFKPPFSVVVILYNADRMDHQDNYLSESVVLTLLEEYLTPIGITAQVLLEATSSRRNVQSDRDNVTPTIGYCPIITTQVPSHGLGECNPAQTSINNQRTTQILRDTIIQSLINASKLPTKPFTGASKLIPKQPSIALQQYAATFPKPTLHPQLSLLPFLQATHPQELAQLQLDSLTNRKIHFLPLTMYTIYPAHNLGIAFTNKMFALSPTISSRLSSQFFLNYDILLDYLVDTNKVQLDTNKVQQAPMKGEDFVHEALGGSPSLNAASCTDGDIPGLLDLNHSPAHVQSRGSSSKLTSRVVEVPQPADPINGGVNDTSTATTTHFTMESKGSLGVGISFPYRGEDPALEGLPYRASIHHFLPSTPNPSKKNNTPNLSTISITSPQFPDYITVPSEDQDAPRPVSSQGSKLKIPIARSHLPLKQLLALDDHQRQLSNESSQGPHSNSNSNDRYYVHITNKVRLHSTLPSDPQTHPNCFPGIVIINQFHAQRAVIASWNDSFCLENHARLAPISIHIPLILVTVLPSGYNLKTTAPPDLDKLPTPVLGWMKAKPPAKTALDEKSTDGEYSAEVITFHGDLIIQFARDTGRMLTETDTTPKNAPRRTIYHWIVTGLDGYFHALPSINQCAIAHYFSVATSGDPAQGSLI